MNKRSPQEKPKGPKHFLDTSVLRPFLLGSKAYRGYFEEQFKDGRKYISDYVLMEFRRSYLRNILDFYFVLDMPSVETVGDAFSFWSNKYKSSELKAALQFVGHIVDTYKFDDSSPKDKNNALREIGRYVKRLELKSRKKFRNIAKNETHCLRSKIPLQSQHDSDMTKMFQHFLQRFNDVKICRSQCSIAKFFLIRYKSEVEVLLKYADTLSDPKKSENIGFCKIANKIKKAQQDHTFSCHLCEAIGDAVIALECLREMRLEHTDHSFDHLCPIIDQSHYKHPSEIAVLKDGTA